MKQKLMLAFILTGFLSVAFHKKPVNQESMQQEAATEPACRFEGSYILEPAGGAATYGLDMALPLDAKNERVALIHEVANYDVTFGGTFPTAVRLTSGHGEAVRTGPRTFDYTLYFWALDNNNQRVAILVSSGTKQFPESDCNTYITTGGMLSVFPAWTDADKDGYPDKGQSPKICLPLTCKARRSTVLPPCKP